MYTARGGGRPAARRWGGGGGGGGAGGGRGGGGRAAGRARGRGWAGGRGGPRPRQPPRRRARTRARVPRRAKLDRRGVDRAAPPVEHHRLEHVHARRRLQPRRAVVGGAREGDAEQAPAGVGDERRVHLEPARVAGAGGGRVQTRHLRQLG